VKLNFIEGREVGSLIELSGGSVTLVEVNIFKNNIIFGAIIKGISVNNPVKIMIERCELTNLFYKGSDVSGGVIASSSGEKNITVNNTIIGKIKSDFAVFYCVGNGVESCLCYIIYDFLFFFKISILIDVRSLTSNPILQHHSKLD
jgi:hypothetical protein